MFRWILLLVVTLAMGISSNSYAASIDDPEEKRDDRLFPRISEKEVKFFVGIPIFDPQKDMAYLCEESQNRIRGISERFCTLREFFVQKIAKNGWVVDSSSSDLTIGKSKKTRVESCQYKIMIHQLTELHNACCYFLANQDYGFFLNPLEEILASIKISASVKEENGRYDFDWCSIRLIDVLRCLLQTPTFLTIGRNSRIPVSFLISHSDFQIPIGLESIARSRGSDDPIGFYLSDLVRYSKAQSSHKEKDISPLHVPKNYKVYLEKWKETQTLFQRMMRDLKVKLSAVDNGALGGDSTISSIAKEIKLLPEQYETFQKILYQRMLEYQRPPVGVLLDDKTRVAYDTAASLIEKELEIAEILMHLEQDFFEAFTEVSKDKVRFWLQDAGLISY